jgi:hypothetical protein
LGWNRFSVFLGNRNLKELNLPTSASQPEAASPEFPESICDRTRGT